MIVARGVFGGGTINNGSSVTLTVALPGTFNVTGGLTAFASIIGMDLSSQNSTTNMELFVTPSTNTTTIIFTITATSATSTTFASIVLQYIVYNTGYFNQPNFATFTRREVTGSATPTGNRRLQDCGEGRMLQGTGPITATDPNLNAATTIVGNNGFSAPAQQGLNYNTVFNGNTFNVQSTTTGNQMTFNYVLMPTYACNVATPFQHTVNGTATCVATCPNPFWGNSATLTCDSCLASCASCTTGTTCTSCNSGLFLRTDNLCYTTCPAGFAANNSTNTCDACPTGCSACSSGTVCTTCTTGYVLLNNGSCLQCSSGCSTCNTAGVCQTCSSFFFLNTTTNNCDACYRDCQICSDATSCQQCRSGYHNENNSCVQDSSSILGPVLGGVLGGLAFLIILIVLIVLCLRDKEDKETKYHDDKDKSAK